MCVVCQLRERERRGSRPRCVLRTDGLEEVVAHNLNTLVQPFARVDPQRHVWMPGGFKAAAEARIGESRLFLDAEQRKHLTEWWLGDADPTANTPNWDILASATMSGGVEGLVLVEAKAHANELSTAGKSCDAKSSPERHKRIGEAIAEANAGLNKIEPGFAISRDTHYQLSNRFAWAWKIASMGVPVILMYLGFLKCDEMQDRGAPFKSAEDWERVMRDHARKRTVVVPDSAWGKELSVNGTPMYAIIRSDTVPLPLCGLQLA